MEKRSRRRTRDLVTQSASQGLSENEIGCARISMMARSTNAPLKGRIQKRKTNYLQILRSHLQHTAGPYRWVIRDRVEPAESAAMSALLPTVTDSRLRTARRDGPSCDMRTLFTPVARHVVGPRQSGSRSRPDLYALEQIQRR